MFPLKQLHTKRLAAMEKKSVATKPKTPPDWERIELDYRAGVKTLRQIGEEHGISHAAIAKRAKASGWERDLAAKIQAKADTLVTKEVTTETTVSDREVIETNKCIRGCKNFCVNGHSAGNCRNFARSRNDRKQRTNRQPAGRLQET
jgi:hypothetical protein